jgi:GTP-binding protein HflX
VPTLQVFNKIDLRADESVRVERDEEALPQRVFVSARERLGLDELRLSISERLRPDPVEYELLILPEQARLRAQLFEHRAIRDEVLDEQGRFHLRVSMSYERLRGLCEAAGVPPPPRAVAAGELLSTG